MNAHLQRFSTKDVPAELRLDLWQNTVIELTGCISSPIEDMPVEAIFERIHGASAMLGRASLKNLRNFRDQPRLADGDEDFAFFIPTSGTAGINHKDSGALLSPGDGMLTHFARTTDSLWVDTKLIVLRLERDRLPGFNAPKAAGIHHASNAPAMRLLTSYARSAWRISAQTGVVLPIVERHLSELVATVCLDPGHHGSAASAPATRAARLMAMREVIAMNFRSPTLSMRHVAAAVGLSERSGHLAFAEHNLSFTTELYGRRLDHARELLARPGARVLDIAFAIGFSDASHFHRLYKKRFGHTPGETHEAVYARQALDEISPS